MAEAEATAEAATIFNDPDLDAGFSEAPPATPEPSEAAGEGQETEQPAEEAQQQGKPEASAAQAPTKPAEPRRYTIRGKKYTAAEAEAAGLLEDLVQSAEQLPHLTRKHQELLEQIAQRQMQPPGQPQQAPPGTQPGSAGIGSLTPQQVTAALAPVVKSAVDQGWIDPDLAEYFPTFAAQAVLHRDLIYDVRAAVADIQAWRRGMETQTATGNYRSQFESSLDNVAAQGDIYEPLKDAETRSGFEKYLSELAPDPARALDPEFLARQWVAYNHEAIKESLIQGRQAAKAQRDRKRGLAAGEASSGRQGAEASEDFVGSDLLDEQDLKRLRKRR